MQGLKCVFDIHLEFCQHCGNQGEVKLIASIEDPRTIEKIFLHLKKKATTITEALNVMFLGLEILIAL